MDNAKNWFDVDRKGLAKLVERRGKIWLLHELIANSWDAPGTSRVDVALDPEEGEPKAWITISDDSPEGFADLRHAWTLFAESTRKSNAQQRGRFNLGEKLVLAMCSEASITTTTGGVLFDSRGRTSTRSKRERGSEFSGLARITRTELAEIRQDLLKLIPPPGIETYIEGRKLEWRGPLKTLEVTLPTEIADEEGVLRRSARKCEIVIYAVRPGEVATLYEMGIPVVETGDKWHVDVQQKIPLNMDRDNVTPAYLRDIRTHVVNAMFEQLAPEDANTAFVNEALADEHVDPAAVQKALELKYGKKRAIFDPTDLEANMNLTAQGYNLIHGSQLTKDQWRNVRAHTPIQAAGRIAPTKKALFSPDGEDVTVPESKWTDGMCRVVGYSRTMARELLGREIGVSIIRDVTLGYAACYGNGQLVYNLGRVGHAFFDSCNDGYASDVVNKLLLHELAHDTEANHLDARYHEALCALGAKLARLALTNPKLFEAPIV